MCGELEHCRLPFFVAPVTPDQTERRASSIAPRGRVRSEEVKVAGGIAVTIMRKETAMTERVITMSFGLAQVCQLNLSDNSVDLQGELAGAAPALTGQ